MQKIKTIEFSGEVRSRARAMDRIGCYWHKYSNLLHAIANSGWMLSFAKDMQEHSPNNSNVQEAIDVEISTQERLKLNNIVDDSSAIAFMNSIESELQNWRNLHTEITARHCRELRQFRASLMEVRS